MIESLASADIKINILKAERLTENTFLVLRRSFDDGYSIQTYNCDDHEVVSHHYHKNFGPAWYQFKMLCVERNGREYQSVYGETRGNRHEAFGLYWENLCGDSGRKINEFEQYYRGSYKDGDQFVYNTLKPHFEASDLPSLDVKLLDLDLHNIRARWFDSLVGSYTSIAINKSYQNGFHVYLVASNPSHSL